eukprot:CAMPEP_0174261028 /NCGR_PEP_ID=MMETSP0439-20130205/11190_1 /TAXON_ID=0 /ORGANISM="Stereomyxa ramosa, Strain Chinc5" /LENGTH=550 /DNA_ID=CAMNT_0015345439 /DNA_START=160 /DNA_END=1809 /DNA_ORIENTATION=-
MGFDHVGFTVPNVKEAAQFLTTMFDAEFDWEVIREATPTAGERGWSDLFNVHPDSYMPHVMMLKCGNHFLTQYIELFEWNSPDQYKAEGGWPKFSDIGHGYISFTVKDLNAVLEHIKKVNWPGVRIIQDPPMNFPLRGETCTSTFIVSPWGMWIELTQWSESGPKGQVISALTKGKEFEPMDCCSYKAHPEVGKKIEELDTPSFLLNMDAFEHNVALMSQRFKEKGIKWRPPVKAHKCPELTQHLFNAGAEGVLVLKVSEAEAFANAGINDIFIANEVIGPQKIPKLIQLAKRVKRLRICVEDPDNIKEIAAAAQEKEAKIEMLVEIDTNHHRCGVTPEEAPTIATLIAQLEKQNTGVVFKGIAGYEGHTPIMPPDEKTKATMASHEKLAKAKELIEESGLKVEVISGGGSSNYPDCLKTGVLTEIQAGGGAICDLLYFHKANLGDHGHKIGASVLTQIMSVPKSGDRAMGDAGFKTMGWHPFVGFPEALDRTDIEVYGFSAEHVKIKPKEGTVLKRGDKIRLIPGYCDSMLFLHKQIYAERNGVVEGVW